MSLNKTQRKKILEKLESLSETGHLEQEEFLKIKALMSSKIGLSFEMMEDDYWKNYLEEDKFVFLKKHRKCKSFSVSDAKTYGSLIEGDNLPALFLLQNIYKLEKNKVDLIYIDPPYNTTTSGFIYNNDYRVKGEKKGLCAVNDRDNFRHSKWLSIMKVRLELARNLLKRTGLIAVSIDDNELYHLKLLMDDVFGSQCYKGTIIWQKGVGMWTRREITIRKDHEYVLVYEKVEKEARFNTFFKSSEYVWMSMLTGGKKGEYKPKSTLWYPIFHKGEEIWPVDSKGNKKTWNISRERYLEEKKKWNISFSKNKEGNWMPKIRIKQKKESYLKSVEKFNSGSGSMQLQKDLGSSDKFDYPKSIALIKHLIKHMAPKNGLVLDFFAGSGTTACAVAELNQEDGGERKFVLVTNNDGDDINKIGAKYCVFQDVLYPRLERNKEKYQLSCKIFIVEEVKDYNETFISKKEDYSATCVNLLSILDSKKSLEYRKGIHKNFVAEVAGNKYSFVNQTSSDISAINMRFAFNLRKLGS